MEILIRREGKEEGPYSKERVQALLDEGLLRRTDMAYYEGLSNWMPLAAVLAPRVRPPPYQPNTLGVGIVPNAIIENNVPNALAVTPAAGSDSTKNQTTIGFGFEQLKVVLGFKQILQDKSWRINSVKWLLCFSFIPFAVLLLDNDHIADSDEIRLLTGAYWLLAWAFGFFWVVRPSRLNFKQIVFFTLGPALLGAAFVVFAGKIGLVSSIYAATTSNTFGPRILAICIIAILQQSLIGIFFYHRYVRRGRQDSIQTIIYLGCLSGMAFNLSPNLAAVVGQQGGMLSTIAVLGRYGSQSLTELLASTVLAAILAGLNAHFMALAAQDQKWRAPLASTGILLAATLSALYQILQNSVLAGVVVVFSVLLFVMYLQHKDQAAERIKKLHD